jgi:hypothetical protein
MRLLDTFESIFRGTRYLHRNSALGDMVAVELYEDLVAIGKSTKIANRVASQDRVVNLKNVAVGKNSRRGDGVFGELVPSVIALTEAGFVVARGPTANIEVGVETKILAKAMIKQIDRVINDLKHQVEYFREQGGNPICVGVVGINCVEQYTSYEGERAFETDGKKSKHPIQEAAEAEARLRLRASPHFDEFLILPFKATNAPPYPFSWKDRAALVTEYNAALVRLSRMYDTRF